MSDSKYAPRRAQPGERFVFNHYDAKVSLTADDEGLVHPKNATEDEVADLLFLPVARSVVAAEKAKAPAKPKAKAKAKPAATTAPTPAPAASEIVTPTTTDDTAASAAQEG